MLFPTLGFGLFFILIFFGSWGLRAFPNLRKYFLIIVSYYFYAAWDWRFCFLLLGSSLLNYAAAYLISQPARSQSAKRWILGLSITANLVVLGFFKYYGFFIGSLADLLLYLGWERDLPWLDVILPVGISFFTFQGISYVVDVYRGQLKHPGSLADVILYISFFPQLVAGPIVRAAQFMPQLQQQPDPQKILASMAILLILWGLFKKAIVANYLAVELVDPVFFDPLMYGTWDIWLAIYAYAVQIYCDFSAYSDIAIGVAALLGYHFPRNFDQPYRAASLQEFWHRWHISLSTWLRDYLYIPLGGSRGGEWKTQRNLFLTMLLGGLWHGASWKFVFWGALHGGGLVMERSVRLLWPHQMGHIERILRILVVFHIVCFGWIFFRAESFTNAWTVLQALTQIEIASELVTPFLLSLCALGVFMHFTPPSLIHWLDRGFKSLPGIIQGLITGAVIVAIEAFGVDGVAPFIYFQF